MKDRLDIPIAVIAYNRIKPLQRLLRSLVQASYDDLVIKLYICIDGGGNDEVIKLAHDFDWPFGVKQVIIQSKNLGLKEHVLRCGNLSQKHDGILILEDDMFVSPIFYQFAIKSCNFYYAESAIAGISLYSHLFNESAQMPFIPINDGFDVFFIQVVSSWGQVWLKSHWKNFVNWYNKNDHTDDLEISLPPNIMEWPDSSWKKFFSAYIIAENKYFVNPRISYTTNFGDPGTHFDKPMLFAQMPVNFGNKLQDRFVKFNKSRSVYDSYYEILPEIIKKFNKRLAPYNFDVDLYGVKSYSNLKSTYVLTSRKVQCIKFSFGLEMMPHELNVICDIEGDDILFAKVEELIQLNYYTTVNLALTRKKLIYYYRLRDWQLRNGSLFIQDDQSLDALSVKLLLSKIIRMWISKFKILYYKLDSVIRKH